MLNSTSKDNNLETKSRMEKILQSFGKIGDRLNDFTKETLTKMKDLANTNYDLAIYHMRKGNISDAILRFKIVTYFQQDHLLAHFHLARCLIASGKVDKALDELHICQKINPGFKEADYILATIDNNYPKPQSIPLSVIEDYFEDLAEFYQHDFIETQNYKGPQILFNWLTSNVDALELNNIDALDIGCGTGFSGIHFKEHLKINNFTGIDISSSMLSKAKVVKIAEIPVYDFLENCDFEQYLETSNKVFNLIIACYSLHYSPYLASNLKNAKLRLDKGGVMVFSVQKSHDQDCTFNDKMSNYCFSKNYIEEIAKEAGYLHCNISEDIILEGETSLQVILR